MKDKRKYADRAEYLKIAVVKRRKVVRQKAIEYKGGKCQFFTNFIVKWKTA